MCLCLHAAETNRSQSILGKYALEWASSLTPSFRARDVELAQVHLSFQRMTKSHSVSSLALSAAWGRSIVLLMCFFFFTGFLFYLLLSSHHLCTFSCTVNKVFLCLSIAPMMASTACFPAALHEGLSRWQLVEKLTKTWLYRRFHVDFSFAVTSVAATVFEVYHLASLSPPHFPACWEQLIPGWYMWRCLC